MSRGSARRGQRLALGLVFVFVLPLALGLAWILHRAHERHAAFYAGQPTASPEYKRVVRAVSSDGLGWRLDASVPRFVGSTSELADFGAGLVTFYWAPGPTGGLLRRADSDATPRPVFTVLCHGGDPPCVDPDVVPLPGGGFRLYYVAATGMGDPAQPGQVNAIRSAFSRDGVFWTPEEGARLSGALVDPDVVTLPQGGFRMYFTRPLAPGEPGPDDPHMQVESAFSPDGLGFTREEGVRVRGANASSTVALPEGGFRMYYHTRGCFLEGPSGDPTVVVHSALSEDGLSFTEEATDLVPLPPRWRSRLLGTEAPGVIALPGGGYAMSFTSLEEP